MFKSTGERIEIISSFCVFLLFMNYYPLSDLNSEKGIGAVRYFLLFLLPIFSIVIAFLLSLLPQFTSFNIRLNLIKGAILGIEASMGFLTIMIVYFWYSTPGNEKLEPLFVTFSLATGGAEVSRRMLEVLFNENSE